MTRRLRIAQVPTVSTPVRPFNSGSIESLVWQLTRKLVMLGHEVTVFGIAGSEVPGELVETLPGPYARNGSPEDWHVCEWINLVRAVEQSERFDIIHTHAYLWGLPLEGLSKAPMVHTLHVLPGRETTQLVALYQDAYITGPSRAQWATCPDVPAAVIGWGVDPAFFSFEPEPDDYALFLGRFIPDKGALRAVECARTLGIPLRLAGPRNDYFSTVIEPHVDGETIKYEGWVSGEARDALLGHARVLLYPLVRPEPFGLVQVEAMMCGTPVAAFSIGASPEIVDNGVTGWCADTNAGFEAAVLNCLAIDRTAVRARTLDRFSLDAMANAYVNAYEDCLSRKVVGKGIR